MSGHSAAGGLLHQRRAAAWRVDSIFGENGGVSAVLVFGSVASGHVDERSDVDILVVCTRNVPSVAERRSLLSQIGMNWLYAAGSDQNALFAEADVDGVVDGIFVTVHYQTVAWISEVLEDVLERGAVSTRKMPFRAYTLPALLQRALLLRDKDGWICRWRVRAQVYPALLKLNVLEHFVPILRENVGELLANTERGFGPRVFIFRLDRAVDALLGIVYALNDTYDPADRRAETTVLPALGHVPDHFGARLTDVLEGPFNDAGARRRARLFADLASDVLRAADLEMPRLRRAL